MGEDAAQENNFTAITFSIPKEATMIIERTATIAATGGLHARPAAIFSTAAAEYENLDITMAAAGETPEEAIDATSILALMSFGAAQGDTVVLRAKGIGAEEALDHLTRLLEINHDDNS